MSNGRTVLPPIKMQPMTKMINNNGLFMLLSVSTKPLAKQFMKQYIDDIMPSITKTGKYISTNEDMEKITELNNKVAKLRNKKVLKSIKIYFF